MNQAAAGRQAGRHGPVVVVVAAHLLERPLQVLARAVHDAQARVGVKEQLPLVARAAAQVVHPFELPPHRRHLLVGRLDDVHGALHAVELYLCVCACVY